MKQPFKRILVATDFSRHSDEAARLALPLLARGGRIRLLHVVHPVYVPIVSDPGVAAAAYDPVATRHATARALRHLKALAASLKGAKAGFTTRESLQPARAMAAEAKAFRAGLVCISTHGRSGLSRLFSGSVAQKFLSLYRGQVLLYRPSHESRR